MKNTVYLSNQNIPHSWYNLIPDIPFPIPPVLDPISKKPYSSKNKQTVFAQSLLDQEVTKKKWVEIPSPVIDAFRIWRPTPLRRAIQFEKAIKTKFRIYYKNESTASAGSFKQNTAVAQAYYNKQEGIQCLVSETGAGQWGSALSFSCQAFGLKCKIYMVNLSYDLKPSRVSLMRLWGADVIYSPSRKTKLGRRILKTNPKIKGSLGISASEAVEDAYCHPKTNYAAASLFNYVNLHQSIIGLEVKKQMGMIKDSPDYLIGCVGGGSNFAGLVFPFIKEKMNGAKTQIIAVEPTACPTLTKGYYLYDYADTGKFSALQKMYTLGHSFIPPPVHTTGLRFHGCSPIVSLLRHKNLISAISYNQIEVLEAALLFAKTEGLLPAPETAHAVKAAMDLAQNSRKEKCLVFNFSGHGYFDLAAYEAFLNKKLLKYKYPVKKIAKSIRQIMPLQP